MSGLPSFLLPIRPAPARTGLVIRAFHEEVKDFFTDKPSFRHIKNLSPGMTAQPILLSEHGEDGSLRRKLVVKVPINRIYDDDLRTERQWLDALRGSPHIIAALNIDVSGLRRPVLVMEYAARGDLAGLVDRLQNEQGGPVIPNRMMWRFFLCLTRAVVAMAYPRIGINPVAGFWENGIGRETIPASGVTPSRLQHWDMHLGNVFVGDVNRIDREHELSPLLKLSDFGDGALAMVDAVIGERIGIANNLADVGVVMLCLSQKMQYDDYSNSRSSAYYTYLDPSVGANKTILTLANDDFANAPIMPALKGLLFRCMAFKASDRPMLPEVLQACEDAIQNLTQADFAATQNDGGASESDDTLRAFVRKFLHNADDEEDTDRRKRLRSSTRSWRVAPNIPPNIPPGAVTAPF